MARISLMLGKNRDIKFSNTVAVPVTTAGSAADFEVPHLTVPALSALIPVPTGAAGDLAINALQMRAIYLMPAATITGNATNSVALNFNVRRNLGVNIQHGSTIASGSSVVTPITGSGMNNIQVGTRLDIGAVGTPETVVVTAVTATTFTATFANAHTFVATPITIVNSVATPFMALPVNTTSATTISASTMAVTPLTMSNIVPGISLFLTAGTGAAETVVVQSVTATTFTATFANGHSGAYTITYAPLATINYNLTTVISQQWNTVLFVPTQFNNVLLAGDIVTYQRTSNNVTGLALPLMTMEYEYVPARIGR